MTTLDSVVFRFLNDVLGDIRIVVELAYFLADYAPALVISVLIIYFFVKTRHRDHVRFTLLVASLAACMAWIISILLIEAFFRPRPFTVMEGAHLLISSDRDSSFPNVTTAWFAAVALATLRVHHRVVSNFLVVTAILFGGSRPILGDHWPTDILASFFLGGLASHLAFKLTGFLTPISDWILRAINAAERQWLG